MRVLSICQPVNNDLDRDRAVGHSWRLERDSISIGTSTLFSTHARENMTSFPLRALGRLSHLDDRRRRPGRHRFLSQECHLFLAQEITFDLPTFWQRWSGTPVRFSHCATVIKANGLVIPDSKVRRNGAMTRLNRQKPNSCRFYRLLDWKVQSSGKSWSVQSIRQLY